jgi:RNA polymerase primary sigma factor
MVRLQVQGEALGALPQFMSEVKRTPQLSVEEEAELLLTLKSGMKNVQARDRLITGYQPLLIGLAKRFARNCKQLELLDLVQEGNLGLLQALEKYDGNSSESSFQTFAFSWVRTVMLTAFWQYEQPIRFPLHKVRAIRQMGIVNTRLLSELGREPTIAETAHEMGVRERDVQELIVLQEQEVVSLHTFPFEDGAFSIEETIADPTASDFAEDRFSSVEEALESLPESEQVVIKLRFGFNDGQAYTQKEIADLLSVAISTVVALDRRAQKRLRRALYA